MQFQDTVIVDEWWQLHSDGTFHRYDGPLEARRSPGMSFTTCEIGSTSIAVFIDSALPEATRAAMSASRPDWLDSIVLATLASDPDAVIAVIDAEIAVHGDADPEACAFAVACAMFSQGAVEVVPERYVIRVRGQAVIEVRAEFDWDTETWHGATDRVSDSSEGNRES